uniref:Uncharacterized protein n=1 Tax=Arundo donax TaxID=35708 RepID=A0A0A9G428_ARUDO
MVLNYKRESQRRKFCFSSSKYFHTVRN